MLGETEVGKTCIINAYLKNEFQELTLNNIFIDNYIIKKNFDNLEYIFKIFDTPGQVRFRSCWKAPMAISDGFFMVFAVDNKRSFERVIEWMDFMDEYVDLREKVLYLIGNKNDVEPEKRQVTNKEIEIFAKRINAKYYETSALNNKGINEAFEGMFEDVYLIYRKNNEKEINDLLEIYKKNNKKKTKFLYEIFKKNNKEKINYHYEIDKKVNKEKSNYYNFFI